MKIPPGFYHARAVSLVFTKSTGKGTPAATVAFALTDDGPHKGTIIEWNGWLTDNNKERVAESLAYCGYDSEDEQTVTRNIVQLVIDDEEYTNPETNRTTVRSRVQWVNDPARGGGSGKPMDEFQRAEAKNALRGLVLAKKQEIEKNRAAAGKDDASFGFGANAPPADPPAAGSGSKPMF